MISRNFPFRHCCQSATGHCTLSRHGIENRQRYSAQLGHLYSFEVVCGLARASASASAMRQLPSSHMPQPIAPQLRPIVCPRYPSASPVVASVSQMSGLHCRCAATHTHQHWQRHNSRRRRPQQWHAPELAGRRCPVSMWEMQMHRSRHQVRSTTSQLPLQLRQELDNPRLLRLQIQGLCWNCVARLQCLASLASTGGRHVQPKCAQSAKTAGD